MGVSEQLDVTLAIDLFAWTYRRSIRKYKVILEAMGSPDPFRVRHRERLSEAVQYVVKQGMPLEQTVAYMGLATEDVAQFGETLKAELSMLTAHNCARYRVSAGEVQAWIERGRPIGGPWHR